MAVRRLRGAQAAVLYHRPGGRCVLRRSAGLHLYSSLFIEFEQAQNIVRGSQDSLALASVFSTYPHPALSVGQAFSSKW